jgi:transcriptional regulator GlxA family with amidase domain
LLDASSATTTWWKEGEFRQRYPAIRLDAGQALVEAVWKRN